MNLSAQIPNKWHQSNGFFSALEIGSAEQDVRKKVFKFLRFDVEKFDRKINFSLWQVQVKDVLIQSRLHKALKRRDSIKESGKIVRNPVSTMKTGKILIRELRVQYKYVWPKMFLQMYWEYLWLRVSGKILESCIRWRASQVKCT